ncbi:MAG TPA: hypothetical protein V6D29_13200 [Leptolyngbyaceae cyanobacterium]
MPENKTYAVKATNLTTMQVWIGRSRFTSDEVKAFIQTANATPDCWFYEAIALTD